MLAPPETPLLLDRVVLDVARRSATALSLYRHNNNNTGANVAKNHTFGVSMEPRIIVAHAVSGTQLSTIEMLKC